MINNIYAWKRTYQKKHPLGEKSGAGLERANTEEAIIRQEGIRTFALSKLGRPTNDLENHGLEIKKLYAAVLILPVLTRVVLTLALLTIAVLILYVLTPAVLNVAVFDLSHLHNF